MNSMADCEESEPKEEHLGSKTKFSSQEEKLE